MNCQVFEKVVISLAQNQLMDAAIRKQCLLHSEVCNLCDARLNAERMLMAGIHAVAADIALEEAPQHLETALLQAFHKHKATNAAPPHIGLTGKKTRASNWQLKAVAAGILLLISVIASLWAQEDWTKRSSAKQAISSAPILIPEQPLSMTGKGVFQQPIVYQATNSRPQKRLPYQSSGHRVREVETVTEFFSLSEDDSLDSLESGQIVRVELSGSALLAAGLPVDAAMVNEPVKADVILGHDGQALAIRFVR